MDVKVENLKELRNRMLRLFGESLDAYAKEKEEVAKSVRHLGNLKAQLTDEVGLLGKKRDSLQGDITALSESKQIQEQQLVARKKEAEAEIEKKYTHLNVEVTTKESSLAFREKKLSEVENNYRIRVDQLSQDELSMRSRTQELNSREILLTEESRKAKKLSEELAQKDIQLGVTAREIDEKLSKTNELDQRWSALAEREKDLAELDATVKLANKKSVAEAERLANWDRQLAVRQEGVEDKERLLYNKEVWLEDRAKIAKVHDV